jgi:NAD(P)H dehydrogenase (quinone)
MTSSTILIGGAAGATGGVVAKVLLKKGLAVRAIVRSDDERAQALRARGAEISVADLLDFRAIRRAFDGAKRAYFVYPMRPGLVEATAYYAQAASEVGAEFIVNMSQRTARADARSNSALAHWVAERLLDRCGIPVAHLHPTIFNECCSTCAAASAMAATPYPSGRPASLRRSRRRTRAR